MTIPETWKSPTFDIDRSADVVHAPFAEPTSWDWRFWRTRRAARECYMHIGTRAFESVGGTVAFLMAHGLAVVSVAVVLMLPLGWIGR